MKKFLAVIFAVASLSSAVYAACSNGVCYDGDNIYFQAGVYLPSLTIAQMNTTTALGGRGLLVQCSDCTRSMVCVSSGTGRGAFVVLVDTGTFQALPDHCE
jgi:hypothetical protein